MSDALLIEIGCEEIPARMIREAARELGTRIAGILDEAKLSHADTHAWGGSRRLAVRIDGVEARQADRDEQVLGPPAKAAFTADGALTPAAIGFARKQGIEPGSLVKIETERGAYVGFGRRVAGRDVGEVLHATLPQSVASMPFPKTMRWGDGGPRWVRPIHWILALHGVKVLEIEIFGTRSGNRSVGHRFLSKEPVAVGNPDAYSEKLREAFVVVDPAERRRLLAETLGSRAHEAGGAVVEDEALLEEVVDLVEWPGVVLGRFEESFLELPREILVTTLRHHQKCFSVEANGELLPAFLAVANTDRDPSGHVRRGNEWVVGGRLADAKFFWAEDRKTSLDSRSPKLAAVLFHAKCGSQADKSKRVAAIAADLARRLGLDETLVESVREAGRLAKNDLTTGLVGEFPELQGIIGGLLLEQEGSPEPVHRGVYEHYKPAGAEDTTPRSVSGAVVSVADKLDSVAQLVRAGETPSGTRDPFGLRRAMSGVFRVVEERRWPTTLADLARLAGGGAACEAFIQERYALSLRERGYTSNEVQAVLRPQISDTEFTTWTLEDVVARLDAIKTVRGREDFQNLVDLTKRVDNILVKGAKEIERAIQLASALDGYVEREPAALELAALIERVLPEMRKSSEAKRYRETVEMIARFIDPVERFFAQVLVIDPANPDATRYRKDLLAGRLKPLLTQYFDIRELAGQAEKRG